MLNYKEELPCPPLFMRNLKLMGLLLVSHYIGFTSAEGRINNFGELTNHEDLPKCYNHTYYPPSNRKSTNFEEPNF